MAAGAAWYLQAMTASNFQRVDAGAQVQAFPRTLSPGNWPFSLLLVSAAVLFATPLALDGRWDGAALMIGVIALVPLAVGLRQLLAERRGLRTLAAIHEKGIVWRRLGSTGFLPWSALAAVKARRLEDDDPHTTVYELHLVSGEPPIHIDEGTDGETVSQDLERRLAAARTGAGPTPG